MLPFFMLGPSIDGFRLYPEPRRARSTLPHPTFPVTSTAVPSSPNLCARCIGVYPERLGMFGSPDVDLLDAASSISPVSAGLLPRAAAKGTKSTEEWVTLPIVNPIFQSSHRFISNSHRITFFAPPLPLNPNRIIFLQKTGGVPIASRLFPNDLATRRNAGNSNPFKGLLHNRRTPRVGGAIASFLCATSAHGVHLNRVGASASTPSRSGRYPYSFFFFVFQLSAVSCPLLASPHLFRTPNEVN